MSPAEKTGGDGQCYYNMMTLENPSSNICENEWEGRSYSFRPHPLPEYSIQIVPYHIQARGVA